VRQGEALGEIGLSGNTLLPHLHIEAMDAPDPRQARLLPLNWGAWLRIENDRLSLVEGPLRSRWERVRSIARP
jgi:murein DD-endopeptidase MepM/ murein hydrolase activator NlpD